MTGLEPLGSVVNLRFHVAAGSVDSPCDIVLRTDRATAFTTAGWWPNDHGHVLVIPNTHYENIFDLPPVRACSARPGPPGRPRHMCAVYGCDGVCARQRNEPAGGQDFWHPMHGLPWHHGDDPYRSHPMAGYATAEQRPVYTDRMRQYFNSMPYAGAPTLPS
ncbi:HIT family protein [Nocardia tengchongensis]|uniref:HIT family protein n=1 Tax=Nocardia tengchongensis TaxID=2055889 RepID=UPI0036B268CA